MFSGKAGREPALLRGQGRCARVKIFIVRIGSGDSGGRGAQDLQSARPPAELRGQVPAQKPAGKEPHELMMFPFESEDGKRPMGQLKAVRQAQVLFLLEGLPSCSSQFT